jgi:hypothetical protein
MSHRKRQRQSDAERNLHNQLLADPRTSPDDAELPHHPELIELGMKIGHAAVLDSEDRDGTRFE